MSPPRGLGTLLTVAFACFVGSSPGSGQQEEASPALHYIADFKVAWEDFPEWVEDHREHGVALLDSLVAEEVITGWSAWQHNTGSDYNWRLVVVAEAWADFDTFWDEYRARWPEDETEIGAGAIRAHRDGVWNEAELRIPESAADARLAYQALYQIDFDDVEAWQEHRESAVIPILEQAMADGILAGWVVETHNTGDRFNRSEVYLFHEWDHIDDFWDRLVGELMADEEVWDRVGGMIRAHDDAIWERVPAEPGEGSMTGR